MVKYSNGLKYIQTSKISHKNRGLGFEYLINTTNSFYRDNNIALIYKKPTPIKIIKTNKIGDLYKISEAVFDSPSTTDYNGIYKGHYIDFEAKETLSKTSFPFSNIHANQITHLFRVLDHGGISFLIISFKSLNSIYLLESQKLKMYIKNGQKSVSLEQLKKDGFLVPSSYLKPINYLEIVEQFLLK